MDENKFEMNEPDEDEVFTLDAAERKASAPSSFEEKLSRAEKIIEQNPNYRHCFYRLLDRCKDAPQPLNELEEFVESLPNYRRLNQPPFFPIHWLEEAFALEEMYLDADMAVHTAEELSGLDEDAFDDLVVQYAFRTTEVGRTVLDEFSPKSHTDELVESTVSLGLPDIYRELLEFLTERRSLADVDHTFREAIQGERSANETEANPGVYIDKLSAAGAILYDEGWIITEEGKEMLKQLQTR